MDGKQTLRRLDQTHRDRSHKRPAWRQHLIQTERGAVRGVRSGSEFFVHFFGCSIVLATAFVMGLSLVRWAVLIACMTLVLSAEMFNQAIKAIIESDAEGPPAKKSKAQGISTAAVMVAIVGALVAIGLVFVGRLTELLAQ